MDTKTVALIGCGYWGPNYARVFTELQNSKILYFCDIDEKKLLGMQKRFPHVKGVSDYKTVLESDIDAVVISTPASTHYKIAKEALKHNKHVIVEKPMALNPKECAELDQLAHKQDKVLLVGHVFLYDNAIRKIKEYLEKRYLGDIRYIHFTRTGLSPLRDDVNAMWDLAPHDISMAFYLIGLRPTHVIATGASFLRPGLEDVVTLTLFFPKNIVCFVHVSWLDAIKIRKINIVGSEKMLIFDDLESLGKVKIFDKSYYAEQKENPGGFGEFMLQLREGDIFMPHIAIEEPLKVMCKHFMDCVESGKRPLTDGRNGSDVVTVLEAATQSLRNGNKKVEIRWS